MPQVDVRELVADAAGVPVAEVGDPLYVARQGDVDWVIVGLRDGRWAAADDAEFDPARVAVFPTREEAVAYQRAGIGG